MIKCKKCKEEKNESEFYIRIKNKSGYNTQCKICIKLVKKKWADKNPDKVKEMSKKTYEKNKDKRLKEQKQYRIKNKEKVLKNEKKYRESESRKKYLKKWHNDNQDYNKEYYQENKETIKKNNKDSNKEWNIKNPNYHQEYSKKNKDKIKKTRDKYLKENKDKINNQRNKRRKEDKLFYIKHNISSSLRSSLKKNGFSKNSKTSSIIGCSYEYFIKHIEDKFKDWMKWENHGEYNGEINFGWDLDHIIPLASAKTEEEIYELFHYTNYQPLCSKINRDIKIDKIDYKG